VDGRDKPGHDDEETSAQSPRTHHSSRAMSRQTAKYFRHRDKKIVTEISRAVTNIRA
jgi:hypothetical protein